MNRNKVEEYMWEVASKHVDALTGHVDDSHLAEDAINYFGLCGEAEFDAAFELAEHVGEQYERSSVDNHVDGQTSV